MLGSRKLLIFGIVSALVLSLLIVSAFAAVPEDVKSLGGGGGSLRLPAPDSVQPPNSPFKTTYNWRSTANGDTVNRLCTVATPTSPIYVHFVYFAPFTSGYGPTINVSFEEDVPFYIIKDDSESIYSAYTVFIDGVQFSYTRADMSVGLVLSSFSELPTIPTNWDISVYQAGGYLLPFDILSSILGIGSQLVSFVVARPIVLIPLVAMVLVLGYGVIRRLIKGV